MGGTDFYTYAWGKDAGDAFRDAQSEARYEEGHGGYTGTIAEKHCFVVFFPPADVPINTFCNWIEGYHFDKDKVPEQHRQVVAKAAGVFADKWGPAVCIPTGKTDKRFGEEVKKFIFIGIAST